MVKKIEIITDLERSTVTVAYCASTEKFSERSTNKFSGQGIFFGISAFRYIFVLQRTKPRPSREKFQSFDSQILLKLHFE